MVWGVEDGRKYSVLLFFLFRASSPQPLFCSVSKCLRCLSCCCSCREGHKYWPSLRSSNFVSLLIAVERVIRSNRGVRFLPRLFYFSRTVLGVLDIVFELYVELRKLWDSSLANVIRIQHLVGGRVLPALSSIRRITKKSLASFLVLGALHWNLVGVHMVIPCQTQWERKLTVQAL